MAVIAAVVVTAAMAIIPVLMMISTTVVQPAYAQNPQVTIAQEQSNRLVSAALESTSSSSSNLGLAKPQLRINIDQDLDQGFCIQICN
jgi:hypothetical protein